jgi:hypothetical protein
MFGQAMENPLVLDLLVLHEAVVGPAPPDGARRGRKIERNLVRQMCQSSIFRPQPRHAIFVESASPDEAGRCRRIRRVQKKFGASLQEKYNGLVDTILLMRQMLCLAHACASYERVFAGEKGGVIVTNRSHFKTRRR